MPPSSLIATRLHTLISAKGTQTNPVRDLRITNIGVRDAASTFMVRHGVPSGGDWSLPHVAAIQLHGVSNVAISRCHFVRLDGSAVLLSGYARGVVIAHNKAKWLGAGFAVGWGDTDGHDGTSGTQPRGTVLDSNFVSEIGVWQKQSSAWFQAKSCSSVLRNNIFVNGPRAAVNFNDGFGGNNTVTRNLMWNMCRESGDHGPINSWDRVPFLTHVKYGPEEPPSWEARMSDISENFISANYGSSQAFDTDDGSSYYDIHDNVWYASDGMKMDYHGHDSKFHHNLVTVNTYDGQNCMNGGNFPAGHEDEWHHNTCILTGCRGSPRSNHHGPCEEQIGHLTCDSSSVTALKASMQHGWQLHDNRYYTVLGNASLPCGITVADAAAGGSGVEANSSSHTLPTDAQLVAMARMTLKMT